MTPEHWVYATVFLFVATNLATAAYAVVMHVRAGGSDSGDSSEDEGSAEVEPTTRADAGSAGDGSTTRGRAVPSRVALAGGDPDSETVSCRNCGAENDPAYRYCRGCASELPGVRVGGRDVSNRRGRSIE